MSVHVSSDVWRYSKATGGSFTVLLSLADQANDDGECWPKLATIASRSRVSRASVSRHLAQLRELGELEWEDRRARGLPNFYRVTVGATTSQSETGSTSQSETTHVSPVSRLEPSLEPSEKDSSSGEPDKPDDLASVFAAFWSAYPTTKTMSRKQALAQFVAAVRKRGVDPDQLVVAAGRWAKECADRGTEPHYVRHAERWLRDERYEPYLAAPDTRTDDEKRAQLQRDSAMGWWG